MIKSETSDLYLTYIESSLGKELNNYRNHPDVRDWCRQTGLIDDRQQAKWLESITLDPTIKMYAIGASDKAVGVCGFTSISHVHQKAEFSLYVFPAYRKKGIAKEALHILFKHGFEELNLNMIWGETFDANPAFELFLKMGMKVDGRTKDAYFKKGKFIASHFLSIRRDEWNDYIRKNYVGSSAVSSNRAPVASSDTHEAEKEVGRA